MKNQFITEKENTRISNSFHGWQGETMVKVKGYCYMITTIKTNSGKIVSRAMQVNDEGKDNNFRSISFGMDAKTYPLLSLAARATEKTIRELHLKALAMFDEMTEDLPDKEDSYKIEVGQVLTMEGSESRGRKIIYQIQNGKYFWVEEGSLKTGSDSLNFLKSIEDKFGIGIYYLPGQKVPEEEVKNLISGAKEKQCKDDKERPAREEEAKRKLEAETKALKELYPYLIPAAKHGGAKEVAKNIRIELKRAFANVPFSVKMDGYDSVLVCWTNGPLEKEVSEITNKYEDHKSDITGDFRDYSPSLFNDLFGGCNYVFERREIAPESKTESTQEPVQLDDVQVTHNEEKNGIEVKFPAKPSSDILDALRNMGFRWSRFNGVWWARYNPQLWEQVVTLVK